jgi:hypothetical protein
MSVSSILSCNLFSYNAQSVQDRMQQFRKDFQQLGQDLQTGKLSGAQADFAAMQKDGPQSSSSAQSSNPIAQTIQQLSTDIQSGNLTAAQQDYTNLQQDFQNQASPMQRPHHHHRNHSGGGQDTAISQVLSQLGQDLQSGAPDVGAEGLWHVAAGSRAVRDRERSARRGEFDDGERQRVSGESWSIRAGFPAGWERLKSFLTAEIAKKDRKGR